MTPADIKDQIKSVLAADADLVALPVKKIFEGNRENVKDDDYPCIMLEIVENEEVRNDMNTKVDLIATFAIGCFMKVIDPDDQLDEIMNFEKLVKKALSQDVTLSGNSLDLNFLRTVYDTEFWPIRAAVITIEVLYRQTFTTRT